jgi:hypothetical protein
MPRGTRAETGGETRIDKMLKLGFTEEQKQFQQNVETGIDKTSKPVSTESANKNGQNVEAINISNNKYIYNKNNKYNNACAREEGDGEKVEYEHKKNETVDNGYAKRFDNTDNSMSGNNSVNADNGYEEIINRFTENEKVRDTLREYVKMRQKRPKTATTGYILELALKRLNELSHEPETQIKILEQSILNSYPDLYGLKEKDMKKGRESNEYSGNYGSNRENGGESRVYDTGVAGGKADGSRYGSLPGVVRLG